MLKWFFQKRLMLHNKGYQTESIRTYFCLSIFLPCDIIGLRFQEQSILRCAYPYIQDDFIIFGAVEPPDVRTIHLSENRSTRSDGSASSRPPSLSPSNFLSFAFLFRIRHSHCDKAGVSDDSSSSTFTTSGRDSKVSNLILSLREISAEAEKGSQNWSRLGLENLPTKTTESTSSLGSGADPVVSKYISSGLNREAVPLAVANYGDNPEKVQEYANGFTILMEMGFSSNSVADALLMF